MQNRAESMVDWLLEAMSHAEATRIFAANGVAAAGQLDAAALKEAWHKLACQWHPDRAGQGSTRKAQDINAAYDVLKGSAQHGWHQHQHQHQHQHRQSQSYQRGERTKEQEQGYAEWMREEERQAAEQTRAWRANAQQRQADEQQRQANERNERNKAEQQRQANERNERNKARRGQSR